MYHIKDDQRSIRSAQMLYEGLSRLMREQDFSSISVTDLVEASQVGRATYYRNFDEIEDILRLQSDQIFDDMIQYIIAYVQEHGNESRMLLLKPVLRYFDTRSEIIELLVKANRLDIAMASLHRAVAPFKTRTLAYLSIDETYIDYIITIRIGIVMNILVQWIENGKQQPPDKLADLLSVMIKNMVTLDQLL